MFRADPSHSGVYRAAGVPVLHGVKWKFRAKGADRLQPRGERRARVLRQQRPQRLRPRRGQRRTALEVRHPRPRHRLPRGGGRHGLHRQLRWQLLRPRRRQRRAALEVRHRGRTALRRAPPAWRRAGCGNDARSLRPVSVLARRSAATPCTSAAATATCMRWTPTPARCAGSFTPATWCTPPRRWPTARCTSAAGTATSMRSMRRAARSAGASRPARTPLINNQVGIQSSAVVADGHGVLRLPGLQALRPRCQHAARSAGRSTTRARG